MAKLFASDTAIRVTTDCVQLLGGVGYTKDLPAERFLRDDEDHADLRGDEPDPAGRHREASAPRRRSMTEIRHIRLRSPAPTGFLHIGSVRTALYNWLHARHVDGTFILRIEDTDVARSTQESVDQIQQVMHWLGLEWDEGPYLQSAASTRTSPPRSAWSMLATRTSATAPRPRSRSATSRRCAKVGLRVTTDVAAQPDSPEQRAERVAQGQPVSVRFRTPDEGRSTFVDVDPGRSVGRVVDDLRLRDRALQRYAGVLPGQRGRRRRHADHARAARRRSHRLDAPCARAAPGARAR